MSRHQYTLEQLSVILDAELRGDVSLSITGIADLSEASEPDISFMSSAKYMDALLGTKAGAVILKESDAKEYMGNALFVSDPYLAFAKLSKLFETRIATEAGVDQSASIAKCATLGKNVAIGPHCVVGRGAVIGDNVELSAGVIVGDEVKIGLDTLIHPNVVLYHQVQIGQRAIIHANTTIGSDGFGFAPNNGKWKKIHQLGRVIIGNDVEIGANTTIDRGALQDTVIGDDVIIDNQVHIAHNCEIGEGTAIAGCVGIAGSTSVGKKCLLGGAVSVNGHLNIADGTMFNGGTVVTKGNREAGVFASAPPLQELGAWRKNSVRFRQLDSLFKRVSSLEDLSKESESQED